MKGRVLATFGCFALSAWLLTGCAGNQTLSEGSGTFDFSNRPQLLIAGATHSDVKGLAMGAARSKGWTIIKSTDDLLIMQRPLDPAAPSAVALGAAGSVVPPVVEVTAAFRDQSGGINVALAAALITQPPGEKASKRADYTENYRDALTQSLESLRANWAANRQRVANAIPPLSPPPETAPVVTPPGSEHTMAPTQTWGETPVKPAPSTRAALAPERIAPEPTPEPRFPAPVSAPEGDQAPEVTPPLSESKPARTRPLPESTPSAAPVVDGSATFAGRPMASTSAYTQSSQQGTEPGTPQNDMLALSPAGGSGIWAANAEQYARLRGCAVADGGTQLIENRSDGELHKVSCVGSESYLLKCQNSGCRELAPVERKSASPAPKAALVERSSRRLEGSTTQTEAKPPKTESKAAKPNGKTDAKAAKPESKTAKPDSKAAKAESKTVKSDSKATKAESKTPKPDSKAAKAESKTAKSGSKAAKAESTTARPDSKVATAEGKTAKADSKTAKGKTGKEETKAGKPEGKTAKAASKAAKSEMKVVKTEKSQGQPSNSKHHVVKPR